jgi:hypothetical protein
MGEVCECFRSAFCSIDLIGPVTVMLETGKRMCIERSDLDLDDRLAV